MKETNLINILKTFSNVEIKEFGKFVASPYHFNGKNCSPLFKQLQKFYPDFDSKLIVKEAIYKKLYPGKKFNKQVMWNLTSAMEKMTKEFLVHASLKKNKISKTGFLLSEFGSRKLLNDYPKVLAEMEKLLESNGIDYDYFENKGHLENYKQEYYHLIDKIKPMGNSKLNSSEYQIMLFLRMTAGGLNDMKILREKHNCKYDVNLPLEFVRNLNLGCIVEYADMNKFKYAFLIEIYYHAIMMHLEPERTEHLTKIRILFGKHFNKFTMSEKRTIMHWIINYCLDNEQSGDMKYKRIVFELNEIRLKEGLVFYPEDQIPKAIYIQILLAAIAVNEIDWAADFVNKYTIKLHPDGRNSMKHLANAFLSFYKKEYRDVLKNLNIVGFLDIEDKYFARTLTAKSYYELNEMEALLSYIDSSIHFLKNNPSVTAIYRIYIHNFLKCLKKIIFARENKNYNEIYNLKNEISKIKQISNMKWLLEKLDELVTYK